MTFRSRVAACVAMSSLILGCGGDARVGLNVDEIDEAVAAVVEVTGRPAMFFEINATPDLINLFLDDGNGNAINFVWEDGALRDETEAAPAGGRAFDASAMTFTTDVYALVAEELPKSVLRAFTITADGPNGEVLNRVMVQSERGGQFGVLVESDGKILGSDALVGQ